MKNLFEEEVITEVYTRIEALSMDTQPLWGKMDVAQMLAHCTYALDMASSKINPPRRFIGRLIGGFFKSIYYSEKPFSKGSPTDKMIAVTDERDFDREKKNLLNSISNFYNGGEENCTVHPHPFFGKLTPKQWSIGMYKHIDHHLRQFGV